MSISYTTVQQLLTRMQRDEVVSGPIYTGGSCALLVSSLHELPDFYGVDALLPASALLRIANYLAEQANDDSVALLRELFTLKPGLIDKQRLYANATSIPVDCEPHSVVQP
ncbi:hypothetical protein [Stutzerimonas stutzeri]|uniref:hypothetical protein n=1 Tax=Stutzerimonas stutzeri TaxID=316 RepID=UPI0015E4093D|nr:hypothetical protein [Stutzerimonas stutzeri]MBA1280306.1 hypothetical protein [Stutzerimonas stutzeri]